ncbi:dihydroorotate dehydrogenase electron transfer subunit [Dorea sp. D27]|uniref:dihydroorotate dehydrogenase electron transfer subunit n=1 Tax=Dorea sp. D27 TaxID=658665 RepID=UPI0006732652|nr:dihydroorotate dehydrogenase electron transfer subunit [Dorea sp. D27]KMZ52496.1 dihydroorotate dehydrogenase, electron transfer subunit [Dorea sp. D27]
MSKYKGQAAVLSQEQIARDIYSLWIELPRIASEAAPGQFLSLYTRDGSKLLPRPISICEIDKLQGRLRLVYRVTGKETGTELFSRLEPGDSLEVMGPLGNGFPLENPGRAFLIGGGIGIPPMLELAKQLPGDRQIIAGYKDELFLTEDLERYGELYVATEDGSAGTRGNVLDAVREHGLAADVIYACGPTPMLRALKAYAEEHGIVCYISLEEKMACGIGACLACVCRSKETDSHSNVHNKRVCKDGPVFLSTEVEI